MTFPPPAGSNRPKSAAPGKRSPLLPTIGIVAALIVAFIIFAQIYTEVLWFRQVKYLEVFTTAWLARGALFVGAGLLMGAVAWLTMNIAFKSRPVYVPSTPQQENLDRYREAIEPLRKVMMIAVPALLGLFAASSAASQWQTVLLWINQEPFGQTEPQFGLDNGFYVFTLPWLRYLVGLIGTVAMVSLIAAVVVHYLYGGIRPTRERRLDLTKTARIQISVAVGVFVLMQGASIWMQRYGSLTDSEGLVTGATYTDVNAVLPARAIVAIAAVIVALLFVAAAVWGRWRLPIVGTALLVILGIVSTGIYPWVVQRFQVRPSEQTLEAEYINRNLEGTRAAYGIDDVEVTNYDPTLEGESGALRQDAETTASIRLLDPNLVSDSFRQLQQNKQYYSFPEQLDVDRYAIDDKIQDTVIAARELNTAGLGSDPSWYNQTIVYTHGFGVVAAYGNQRASDGRPVFSESGIPSVGELGDYEPRIYFGERAPEYSIVGGPADGQKRELDYPADDEPSGQVNYTFNGDGGPSVGNLFNRLLYAIKFQDEQIVLSDALNDQSQIMYERNPRERVQKVAPFLTVDGDPYPAVVDGKVKWIVDAYTTSAEYPYSRPETLDDVTADSNTARNGNVAALPGEKVNYIRNSVKATVDAFDGSVDLFAWDEQDPVLKSWMKTFPNTIKPVSEISSDLMSHLRYPEDLFKVQRTLLASYHVSDAAAFYSAQDFWTTPNDPTASSETGAATQPPYYLTLQMPGQDDPAFSLTTSFIPRSAAGQTRNVLTGFLAADADAGDKAGAPSDAYGKLRLLQLPRNSAVPGPGQAQNNFNADPTVQNQLNLLRQGSSQVQNGNLLTLPVGGGLLYVQPVYVRSAGETSYPLLQRVLVAFGDQIGFAPTLDEALNQIFGGDSGANAGDANAPDPSEDGDGGEPQQATAEEELQKALEDARDALKESQDALSKGDFGAYGDAQKRLNDAVERATRAQEEIAGKKSSDDATAPATPSAPATP
ncbi:UPF0182 family protein [Saxibacter everestensis]|uniref:UPF0182 protein LWF01_10245 n=1 Tax=Saxibacter everestensis TaxID=2909229 RepID=A0ABY8QQS6_9MICO|nr:UPF0182 family protein [Brevibacteriaceae bacterium ZFBP1038]